MKIAPDKIAHLKYGSLAALFFLIMLALGPRIGLGYTIVLASVVMGWGVERYQAIRHEGTPSKADWFASSLPGVLLGLAVQFRVWGFVL